MSTLLQKPNYARARPSTIISNDDEYTKLYIENQNLDTFYVAACVSKEVERILKKNNEIYSVSARSDILFYVIFLVTAKALNSVNITKETMAKLDLKMITENLIVESAKEIFYIYQELGGNDKVAKCSDLIKKVVDKFNY